MTSPSFPRRLQDAPPRCAHFCLWVERFIRRELGLDPAGQTLLVGFSGGLDSTVLLHVLTLLAAKNSNRIVAAHFDHQLRPDSGQDARAAAGFASALGLDCLQGAGDVRSHAQSHGMGLEEAGRELRHAFLRDAARSVGAYHVCLAHQLDDLAEDQLMRLTRGTGWPELGGMAARDPERSILRPLLLTPRERIRRYAELAGLSHQDDPTNLDRAFFRNRVRQDLLPVFMRENPGYLRAAAGLWRLARVDEAFWNARLDEVPGLQAVGGECVLKLAALRGLPPAVRLRTLKRAVERLGRGQPLLSTILALDSAVMDENPGGPREFEFPGSSKAAVSAGVARFYGA